MNTEQIKMLQERYPNDIINVRKPLELKKKDGRGRPKGFHPPISEKRKQIIEFLTAENKPVRAKEINIALGSDCLMNLSTLVKNGVIHRTGHGLYTI